MAEWCAYEMDVERRIKEAGISGEAKGEARGEARERANLLQIADKLKQGVSANDLLQEGYKQESIALCLKLFSLTSPKFKDQT